MIFFVFSQKLSVQLTCYINVTVFTEKVNTINSFAETGFPSGLFQFASDKYENLPLALFCQNLFVHQFLHVLPEPKKM